MKVCVIGTGYVGLTTGIMLAELGHQVTCVDIDKEKIALLQQGKVPIYEPGTEELVIKHLNTNLKFTAELSGPAPEAMVIMIAVGTPPGKEGIPDISAVEQVARELIPFLTSYKVLIIKSTVPVGTNDKIRQLILDSGNSALNFDMVSNPEFLREGCALHDCFHTDRIVIGGDSPEAISLVWSMYSKLTAPCVVTSLRAAEMIKYVSNAFLAMKISFTNEIAAICEGYSVDIKEVTKGVGFDHRIGHHFLGAGAGYGGSCLPKDLQGLLHMSKNCGTKAELLKAVKKVNDLQITRIISKLEQELGELAGKEIALWGLTFKPDTDDLRAAPALSLIPQLLKRQAKVRVYDPIGMANAKPLLPGKVTMSEDMYQAVRGAHGLVIITEWPQFRHADLERVKQNMQEFVVVDGRNIFEPEQMRGLGCRYAGMGR